MRRYLRRISIFFAGLVVIFTPMIGSDTFATPTFAEYSVPTSNSEPHYVTTGSDGALWFTETNTHKIGRVTTSGSFSEYTITTGIVPQPIGITSGPDGNLWFADYGNSKIGKITTSGSITEYSLSNGAGPWGITSGPDGNLWFTEHAANKIGKITTSGSVTVYSIPSGTSNNPQDITSGPDGNLWFTEQGAVKIGKITTSGSFTEYSLSSPFVTPHGIATGPDGNLWFTDYSGNKVGSITTSGTVTAYSIPTSGAAPWSITDGPDGALWFTEYGGSKIARITTSGSVTEYPVPTTGSAPRGITTGPDGALWFTEYATNKIGRLTIPAPAAPTNLAAASPAHHPVLSWDSTSGASSYNIYRDGSNIGTSATNSYTDTTASQGTHTYYVTAVNAGGESSASNSINVTASDIATNILYYTANDGSSFSRQTNPYNSGLATQSINSDGSVTASVNSAPGYADSGFYLYHGPIGGLPDFTVNSTGSDFGLNLWFDSDNDGSFFQWNSSGLLTGLGGDTYGLSPGSTSGSLSVTGSTQFFMMSDGQNHSLSDLRNGLVSGISSATPVTVWIGVDVSNGGSTSAAISSITGLY